MNRLKVCILTKATPFIWVQYYVNAFRAHCDVVTIGPTPTADDLRDWKREHLAHLVIPNDIETDSVYAPEMVSLLPPDWHPDLLAAIQSGPFFEGIPRLSCPTVYISVDTWHDPDSYQAGRMYDFVFAAQKTFVPLFQATGSRQVSWLPLACDPAVHRVPEIAEDHDIVFVGSTGQRVHAERRARLERLGGRFHVAVAGDVCIEEMCRMLCRGRLAFNSSISHDVNMRVFEALACGRTLLTDRAAEDNGLFDLFEDGRHLIAYDDEDLLERAEACLIDDTARKAIARAGQEEVLARHTYRHRVEALLETVAAHVTGFETSSGIKASLVRRPDVLKDLLPVSPGVVIDFGLNLDVSKYGLRKRGGTVLAGVALNEGEAARRKGSYDTIAVWPSVEGLPDHADTFVIGDNRPLQEALTLAGQRLAPGGTLVLCWTPADTARESVELAGTPISRHLARYDIQPVAVYESAQPGKGTVVARKRTRTILDVIEEVYSRFPMPGLTTEDLRAGTPEFL